MEKSRVGAIIEATVERPAILQPQRFLAPSIWDIEHWRGDDMISLEEGTHNVCVNEGLNFMLDVMFAGTAAFDPWDIGIFETTPTPALDGTSTYVTGHGTDWTECSAYDEAARIPYVETVTALVCTNTASKAVFTMNDTKTIYGAFLCGGANSTTKLNVTAGNFIYCAALFAATKSVVTGDVLKVTVAITAADA